MAVLESPDLDKRYAEQSLRFLANDKSVQKFDQILLAEQVTAGTRIAMPGGMGVVIMHSVVGADVGAVVEDTAVGTVEFEEDVGGERPYNSMAPIPAATATAPAPAYFRKRRLEGFSGDLLDSIKACSIHR